MSISNLAYIDKNAKIGDNVTIGPFAFIDDDVVIGENTWIGPNASIMSGSVIGANCRIFPGAVIGAIPQDLKYNNEKTKAIIGDNTTIRECVTVNRGTIDRWETKVGNNCLLMAYVHVAHDCIVGNNVILANAVNLAGHVVIGENAVLGGMSAAHQFVNIGEHSMISGGSLIRKDVPPYITAAREPLAYVGINYIGLKRRNFAIEEINLIKEIYRTIYGAGLNTTQAIASISENFDPSPHKNIILEFLKNAHRGIIRGKDE